MKKKHKPITIADFKLLMFRKKLRYQKEFDKANLHINIGEYRADFCTRTYDVPHVGFEVMKWEVFVFHDNYVYKCGFNFTQSLKGLRDNHRYQELYKEMQTRVDQLRAGINLPEIIE